MIPSIPSRQTVASKQRHHFGEQQAFLRPRTTEPMSADESTPATLKTVAEELNERATNIRARNPDANQVSKEEAAVEFAIVRIGAMKERKQTIRYTTEQYARRVLHLVCWSGSNIGGGVMIEYLIHHGGDELDMYFHRLLDQTGYLDRNDLPEEMRKAIQRMRKDGSDPVESYKPGDSKRGQPWQCTVEQMRLIDELDPDAWPDMLALHEEF